MKYLGLLAFALILSGCAQPGVPTKPAVTLDHDPVAAIRAAGSGDDSVVQVQPLRDAAVEGFLKKAHDAEAMKDYAGAVAATESALKLVPDASDMLQYLAELEIARGNWQRAEELAVKSYDLGPKLGGLCARNWQTVIEVRTVFNDAPRKAQAREHQKGCRVPPPARM